MFLKFAIRGYPYTIKLSKNNERHHANKETIYEKSKEWKSKVECPCGGYYTKAHKAEHEKSKKHINNIKKRIVNITL